MVVGDDDIAGANALIHKWAGDRKIEFADTTPIPDGTSFFINGMLETGVPFTIVQPKALRNTINVLSEVSLSNEHIELLKSMRPKDRDGFLWYLKENIHFAAPSYAFDPGFDKTGILEAIQFSQEIYFDGLTEDRLNEVIHSIAKCVLWTIWIIRRELGDTAEE